MKKRHSLTWIMCFLLLVLIMSSCTNNTVQSTIDITDKQFVHLADYLSAINITIKSAMASTNELVDEISDGFEAYDITTDDGETYILIVASDDKSYIALLNSDGKTIDGMIDNGILPNMNYD